MPKAQLKKLMVIKMKKRRNQIVSIIGSALLVALFAGNACAASNDVPWPRETEDPYFYGYPESHKAATQQNTDVKAFTTQSASQVNGTTYVTPDNFPWPRESEDQYFTLPQ